MPDDAVPWWHWTLFALIGAAMTWFSWRGRRRRVPTLFPWLEWLMAVGLGPASVVFGISATIWTLTARP